MLYHCSVFMFGFETLHTFLSFWAEELYSNKNTFSLFLIGYNFSCAFIVLLTSLTTHTCIMSHTGGKVFKHYSYILPKSWVQYLCCIHQPWCLHKPTLPPVWVISSHLFLGTLVIMYSREDLLILTPRISVSVLLIYTFLWISLI